MAPPRYARRTTPARRLAVFGRWGFFAGWLLGIGVFWAGAAFNMPWWLVVLTGIAVPFAVAGVVDRLAERHAIVGHCGEEVPWPEDVPWLAGSRLRPVCALPHGHAGWHRADDGCEWGLIADKEPA